jgi:hypothetical protein
MTADASGADALDLKTEGSGAGWRASWCGGRQPGVRDRKPRRRSGYVAAWDEADRRCERQRERGEAS